jgi:PAS domain S-box-containing protein
MDRWFKGSIGKNLVLLLIIALIPAFSILLFSGFEQRHIAIKDAEKNVQLLARSMAQAQLDLVNNSRSILSTLALLPEIQDFDLIASEKIFQSLLRQNNEFQNFTLTDLDGEVLASALPFDRINLADRKHFRQAIAWNDFAVGEFIIARVGRVEPAFAFAYPIREPDGKVGGVLTAAVNLSRFSALQNIPQLSENSFIAITDHQGIRLFYEPSRPDTNPIGQPVFKEAWDKALSTTETRIFNSRGSDGTQRVIAFEPIRLNADTVPYAYVWAGISEKEILQPANAILMRNLLLLLAALVVTLILVWRIGRVALVQPIKNLAAFSRSLASGTLPKRPVVGIAPSEIAALTDAFYNMATTLEANRIALATEKEQLAVTLDSIGDAVITTDTAGHVVLMNPIAEHLTGWNIDQAAGRPLGEVFNIINELSGTPCASPVEKVLESGQIVGLANHTVLISRTGEQRSIADSGAPIVTTGGETIGVVLVFRDVTDQYRIEKELQKARKIESLGLLAGGIAHDFNNMLSAILGNIELTLLSADLGDKGRKRLEDAVKASLRARDLTRHLLTFAKGGQPVRQSASLPEIIQDSTDFILHGREISCHYQCADDLLLVDIDTSQISQVIQNLILNAVQAMAKGGRIDVTCANAESTEIFGNALDPTRQYVRVTISDQGEGIPADIIDKVFDPYFSTKQQGSGLGLSIVHSIINKHDGQIQVASTPGKGATFTIYLPAATGKPEQPPQQSEKACTNQLHGKVLVMDDEEPVRQTIGLMLEEFELESLQAINGEEAVRLFHEHLGTEDPIGLTILDLTVPGGMGGQDAAQKILALDPDASIVVASGYAQDPIMVNYREHGFCAALAKPFDLRELSSVLNLQSTASGTHRHKDAMKRARVEK